MLIFEPNFCTFLFLYLCIYGDLNSHLIFSIAQIAIIASRYVKLHMCKLFPYGYLFLIIIINVQFLMRLSIVNFPEPFFNILNNGFTLHFLLLFLKHFRVPLALFYTIQFSTNKSYLFIHILIVFVNVH